MASLQHLLNSEPASPEPSSTFSKPFTSNAFEDDDANNVYSTTRPSYIAHSPRPETGGGSATETESDDYPTTGVVRDKKQNSSTPHNRSITRSPPPMSSNRNSVEASGDGLAGPPTQAKKRGPSKLPKKTTKKPQKKKRKIESEGEHDTQQQDAARESPPVSTEPNGGDDEDVYCICRKPDSGKWMIGCDGCDDWFHGECINVAEEDGDLVDKYYCPMCQRAEKGTTTWKRKCRLPSCRKPARLNIHPPSKYCSQEHGVKFFSTQLASADLPAEQLSALVSSVSTVAEFQCLGDRVPTPPLNDEVLEYPEEKFQLAKINSERNALAQEREALDARSKYIELAKDRQKRISEEIRNEEGASSKGGKEICGFDSRLCYDDGELKKWYSGEGTDSVMENGKLLGRDGVCTKKKCEKHRQWHKVALEEIELHEKLMLERLDKLQIDESKIKERMKIKILSENG